MNNELGCYVDGHWGQYAIARSVMVATEFGFADDEVISLARKHLDTMYPSDGEELTDDEHMMLSECADEVESWMNDNASSEGNCWVWIDGEFCYTTIEGMEDYHG